MKTILVILCCAFCCVLSLQAADNKPAIAIGVRGGVFSSGIIGPDATFSKNWFAPFPKLYGFSATVQDVKPQSGAVVSGGLYVEYPLTPTLFFEWEFLYKPDIVFYEREMTIGAEGQWLIPGKLSIDGRCTYLEVPLLVKKVFPVSGDLDPYLYAGPTVDFLVNRDVKGRLASLNPGDEGIGFATDFEAADIVTALCIGGGVYIRSREKTMFGLDFRYNIGLQAAITSMTIEGSRSRDLDIRFSSFGISGVMVHRL